MLVRNCMSGGGALTAPQASVKDAARLMKEADIGALPVGENDRLVGMVIDRDIAIRAVAESKGADTPLRDVMVAEIHHCFDDEDLDAAAGKTGELQARRLPVLNRAKRLVGACLARRHIAGGRRPRREDAERRRREGRTAPAIGRRRPGGALRTASHPRFARRRTRQPIAASAIDAAGRRARAIVTNRDRP